MSNDYLRNDQNRIIFDGYISGRIGIRRSCIRNFTASIKLNVLASTNCAMFFNLLTLLLLESYVYSWNFAFHADVIRN